MENASKALIIAGAILLAILLISFGMIIINQSRGIIDRDALSEAEVQTFNERFTKYTGTTVKGTLVRSLIAEAHAAGVDLVGSNGSDALDEDSIVNTQNYHVSLTEYDTSGKVVKIKVY